jgi:DNA-directed RNA polymerase subunit RPC12/RpoP
MTTPTPSGPGGGPQDQPPAPGEFPIDPATLPEPIRDELLAPDPEALDTANAELRDGLNRCPRCGSTDVQLRPATGMLVCLFCRNEWSETKVEEAFGLGEGIDQLKGTVIASGAKDIQADVATMLTLKCGGCGAEVVIDTANSMNARCHWCRHVLSANEQVPNGAVPDAVLPFRITHEDAVERIRQFAGKRRLFAHSKFKREFTPENVLGVYLPYMIVDGNVSSDVIGVGEIKTRTYTRGDGDNRRTYYDADVYRVSRHVDFTVDDLTIESSAERARIDTSLNTNNIINTILPFDTKNAVMWNADYLRGFTSEKRDQDVQAITPELENQLMSIGRAQVEGSVGAYDRGVRWEQERLDVHGTRWVSMYLPVWLYSYYHVQGGKGLVHYIAVNARTGETMGSIPVSHGKLLLAALTVGTVVEGLAIAVLVALA